MTFKTVAAKIEDYEIKKGIFSDDVIFHIVTTSDTNRWSSNRNDDDFYELRKLLVISFPYVLIPALMTKDTSTDEKHIVKRQRSYQRFLDSILRNEILKTSTSFVDFMKLQDRSDWLKSAKLAEKTKIFSIVQEEGQMDCTNVPAHHSFSQQVK